MSFAKGMSIPVQRSAVRRESLPIWAEMLHDPNPIHLDAGLVRAMGLGDAEINQGPANLAFVINALTDAFPDGRIEALDIRFTGNVFAGETVNTAGVVTVIGRDGEGEHVTLDVSLAVGDRVVLKGTAVMCRSAA
ncbi:MAG: hypothetical protein KF723_09320 [Rhizobiaceae bacterium]|nr:hypothetical protein [Rhizobiaceae bacterium]